MITLYSKCHFTLLTVILIFSLAIINTAKGQEPVELVKSRKPNMKLFLNPDSSLTAHIYQEPVHYLDGAGAYQPIEPQIIPSTQTGYDYEVRKGMYKAFFKNDPTAQQSVRVEHRSGYYIGFRLAGVGYYETSTRDYHLFQNLQAGQVNVEDNQITYSNMLPGLKMRLHYLSERLKEELVITQQARNVMPDPSQFGFNSDSTYIAFVMEINPDPRLLAFVQDSVQIQLANFQGMQRIAFKNLRKKAQFFLPLDFACLQPEDSTVTGNTIQKLKRRFITRNGKLFVVSGVPYSWITSIPNGDVVIDPTLTITPGASDDTWLENTTVKGGQTLLIVGKHGGGYPKKRTLVKFPVTSIPSGAIIEDAKLKLYYYAKHKPSWVSETFVNRDVQAHVVFTNWSESTARVDYPWSGYGTFGPEPEVPPYADYYQEMEDVETFTATTGVWKEWDVKRAVENWLSGWQNNGLVLWATNEDVEGYDVRMYSKEYSNSAYHPRLEVTYRKPVQALYYLKDHLGSVRVTVNQQGQMVGFDDYYPYGQQIPGRSSNSANPGPGCIILGQDIMIRRQGYG